MPGKRLQTACATDSFGTYRRYLAEIDKQPPVNLRDLLDFREGRAPVLLHLDVVRRGEGP